MESRRTSELVIFSKVAKQAATEARKRLAIKRKEEIETTKAEKITKIAEKESALLQKRRQLQEEYKKASAMVERMTKLLRASYTFTGTFAQITEQVTHEKQLMGIRAKVLSRQQLIKNKAFTEFNNLNMRIIRARESESWKVNNRSYLENEKKERKENALIAQTLFDSKWLNHHRMPEDMLWYEIRPSFMYETKIVLIEEKYNPIKLLNRLNVTALRTFLSQAIRKPEYFDLLSDTEKEQQIWKGTRDNYKPHFAHLKDAASIKRELIKLMRTYKSVNPKAAYEMMRTFCILIDPKKKYKGYFNYPSLTAIPRFDF